MGEGKGCSSLPPSPSPSPSPSLCFVLITRLHVYASLSLFLSLPLSFSRSSARSFFPALSFALSLPHDVTASLSPSPLASLLRLSCSCSSISPFHDEPRALTLLFGRKKVRCLASLEVMEVGLH